MEQSVRNGFRIQRSVIRALFHREMKTRYSKFKLGIFWAVLEPAAHIGTFMVLMGVRNRHVSGGLEFPLLLVTGFIPYFLFMNIMTQVMNAPEGNQGLFGFRQVRPIDAILSRALVELGLSSLNLTILLCVFGWVGYHVLPAHTLEFLAGFLLLGLLGLGLGMIFCAMKTLFDEFGKIIPLLMRPLYFLSGIMVSINSIPSEYRKYLLWNPVLHGIELSRAGFFQGYKSEDVSFAYLGFCTLLFLFLGFSLYSIHWKKMIKT